MERLLDIESQEVSFPYELNKQVWCSIRLSNRTQRNVAFKVMTTNRDKYSVLPKLGVVLPGSCCDVLVTMLGPKEPLLEVQCTDKFLIKSVVASPDVTTEYFVQNLFNNEAGGHVQNCTLGVIYTLPSQIPSPVVDKSFANINLIVEKLLDIESQEVSFPYELHKQVSRSIRLSNKTQRNVAFKIMTTCPDKYSVLPKIGVVLPGSGCDVLVTMLGPTEPLLEVQCTDKFLIKSVVASPDVTTEYFVQNLFNNEAEDHVQNCTLGVIYALSSQIPSPSVDKSGLDKKESALRDFFWKGIIIGILGLIFWYLMMKMLPLIWSMTFVIIMLVGKMINNLLSNSVEDWIVKTLGYVCVHFITLLFRRKANISET